MILHDSYFCRDGTLDKPAVTVFFAFGSLGAPFCGKVIADVEMRGKKCD